MWHLAKTPTPGRLENTLMRHWKREQMFLPWWERWDGNYKSILNSLPQPQLNILWCYHFSYVLCLCILVFPSAIPFTIRNLLQFFSRVHYFYYSSVSLEIWLPLLFLSRHLDIYFILNTKIIVMFCTSLCAWYTLSDVWSALGTILWISSELLRSIGDG